MTPITSLCARLYTFAHTLDYDSFTALPQNSFDPEAEYGNSDFDARQNFTAYLLYALPGSSHGPRYLTNGWKLSSLLSFRSGLPFTVDAYGDPSGTGENTDRPSLSGNPYQGISHSVIDHQPVQWINPNSFTINGHWLLFTSTRDSVPGAHTTGVYLQDISSLHIGPK